MSLVDGGLACHGVLELCTWRHIPSYHCGINRRNRLCCYAKSKVNDDEQKDQTSGKGFSIRVPTIPKLGDSESARRLLESAFQALSLEMPKLPIESALQGLSFNIPRFSIPKQIFIFDITGFVATKLRRPHQQELADTILDQGQYPRCAWPRTSKAAHVGGVLYPHSAWPRRSLSGNGVFSGAPESILGPSSGSSSRKEESSSVIQGGARCAWPRKTVPAKQSCHAAKTPNVSENPQVEVPGGGKGSDGGKRSPADADAAAVLPRRMLATSVGLTVMNQLARGSLIVTSSNFFSLLPAGSLEIAEEEGATLDLGRRTLMVFIRS